MTNCLECGKPLKLIGTARKNGKITHGDWATREYHKKCWLKKQKYSQTINMFNFRENVLDKILNKIDIKT